MQTKLLAQIGITKQPPNAGIPVAGMDSGDLVGTILKNVIITFFTVAAVAFVIMFMWGTVEWILSGGDKEKVAGARKRIVSAIIGLVLISLTYVVLIIVGQITSINLLGDLVIPQFGTP